MNTEETYFETPPEENPAGCEHAAGTPTVSDGILQEQSVQAAQLVRSNGNGVAGGRLAGSTVNRLPLDFGSSGGAGDDNDDDDGDGDDGDNDGRDDGGDGWRIHRKSEAQRLVELAEEHVVEFFSHDETPYATISVDVNGSVHQENHTVRGRRFTLWLNKLFHDRHRMPPSQSSMRQATNCLEAQVQFGGAKQAPVHVRVAEHSGAIYIDLCDRSWRAIRITAAGWRAVDDTPVKFVRKQAMAAQVMPAQGGSLEALRQYIDLESDDDFTLVVGWLISALHGTGPYPILNVSGEQGSTKSTLARMLRSLVDPSRLPVRAPPRSLRDLCIAANNAWILAYDNLSSMPAWFSDGLCRIATGGGFATRALFTDEDEQLFQATRPILLNGISDPATRSDLLDRCLSITAPPLEDAKRRTEEDLWASFKIAQPGILGALFDAVSAAIANVANVKLSSLPRMADAALWVTAAEPALGWKRGRFLEAYRDNRDVMANQLFENSAVALALRRMIDEIRHWKGSASRLLAELSDDRWSDATVRRLSGWPKSPEELGTCLTELAPNIRRLGVDVDRGRTGRGRWWEFRVADNDSGD